MRYKKGDKITLDCGYAPQSDLQECVIIEVTPSYDLFDNPIWILAVKDSSNKVFTTDMPRARYTNKGE